VITDRFGELWSFCFAVQQFPCLLSCDDVTVLKDFDFHKGKSEYEDVLQSGGGPSTMTNRGHQGPAAFLILASGLDKVSVESMFVSYFLALRWLS